MFAPKPNEYLRYELLKFLKDIIFVSNTIIDQRLFPIQDINTKVYFKDRYNNTSVYIVSIQESTYWKMGRHAILPARKAKFKVTNPFIPWKPCFNNKILACSYEYGARFG